MFAIVTIAGFQEKVEKGSVLRVPTLDSKEGANVSFSDVLLIADGSSVTLGTPVVEGAEVKAKILSHGRGDKIRVFKMKRRKRYRRTQGHRQNYTEIEITGITASGAKKAAAKTETPVKKETAKAAPKKATTAKTTKAAPKKTAKADDLTKVEGIGPKIAETLVAAGHSTFAAVAKLKSEKIQEIIADVRGSHVSDTWPKQAQMAADGKWDELKTWQDEMDGGKPA
jgi:large subunit ribosomal protein L21